LEAERVAAAETAAAGGGSSSARSGGTRARGGRDSIGDDDGISGTDGKSGNKKKLFEDGVRRSQAEITAAQKEMERKLAERRRRMGLIKQHWDEKKRSQAVVGVNTRDYPDSWMAFQSSKPPFLDYGYIHNYSQYISSNIQHVCSSPPNNIVLT
jgi:hypothetical protein